MRLDYLIAHALNVPRKVARTLVSAGRVTVNEHVCRRPGTPLQDSDQVRVDGELAELPGHRYLMLNKPAGVITATRDGQHRTVLDLVPDAFRASGLHAAGRLDLETTGLVLLTTDGGWSHRITAPSADKQKTYLVTLAEPVTDEQVGPLRTGVLLKSDAKPTRPARVELLDATRVRLHIVEGRYHQVRRMFAAVGNHVQALHREAIGDVCLDAALGPGECRPLTEQEVASLGARADAIRV